MYDIWTALNTQAPKFELHTLSRLLVVNINRNRGLQGVTGGYKGLQRVTSGNRVSQRKKEHELYVENPTRVLT